MAPGGSFVQFTYGMNSPMPYAAERDFEAEVSPPVWLNLPPARVWIYRRKAQSAAYVYGEATDLAPSVARGVDAALFRPAKFRPVALRSLKAKRAGSGRRESGETIVAVRD